MLDTPEVTLQVKSEVFEARASTIGEGDVRNRIWDQMAEVWPDYNTYAEKTERRIPLVRLTRSEVRLTRSEVRLTRSEVRLTRSE